MAAKSQDAAGANVDLAALQIVSIEGEMCLVIPLGLRSTDPIPTIEKVTRHYRVSPPKLDTLTPFLAESTAPSSRGRYRAGLLYQAYMEWCAAQGVDRLTRVGFSRAMKAAGYSKIHSNGSWWLGLSSKLDTAPGMLI